MQVPDFRRIPPNFRPTFLTEVVNSDQRSNINRIGRKPEILEYREKGFDVLGEIVEHFSKMLIFEFEFEVQLDEFVQARHCCTLNLTVQI